MDLERNYYPFYIVSQLNNKFPASFIQGSENIFQMLMHKTSNPPLIRRFLLSSDKETEANY